jgi:hypothetical protein
MKKTSFFFFLNFKERDNQYQNDDENIDENIDEIIDENK